MPKSKKKRLARRSGAATRKPSLRLGPGDRLYQPSDEYVKRVSIFTSTVSECTRLSRKYGGYASPTGRHYYASVLFVALCSRSTTLAFICPYSSWSKREFEHWDFASVANISRSILETRLNFHYLCIDPVSDDEWDCRWNAFNMHDCQARISLFSEMGNSKDQVEWFQGQAEELRQRLQMNAHFNALASDAKKQILNGKRLHLSSLEELAVRAGIEEGIFRLSWKLMSANVHGLPMSFYRIGDSNRGRGVHSEVEESYTKMLLSFCTSMLVKSRDEFQILMEGVDHGEAIPGRAAEYGNPPVK